MADAKQKYYEKRAKVLLKNLHSHHFEAYYCPDSASALEKALELIPKGASIGWGGATSAEEMGLLNALRSGEYRAIDRDTAKTAQERQEMMRQCLMTDFFITGANALSLDGQMVNVDGVGNRVAAIVYGPQNVLVIAGMNKVMDTLEAAVTRTRTVAAPINMQRFGLETPCNATGVCADFKSSSCICNQLLITRNSKPAGRIKVILVGEELGF